MYFALENIYNRIHVNKDVYSNDVELYVHIRPYLDRGLLFVYGSGCSIGIYEEEQLMFSCRMASKYYNAERVYGSDDCELKGDVWNYSLFTPVPESVDVLPVDSDQALCYLQCNTGLDTRNV